QKTPPELSEQFPLVKEVLKSFNIPHYELDLYEADDIIGTLSTEADKKNWDVKIISGDQDLLQLVTDHVTVDLTRKGISEINYNNYEDDDIIGKLSKEIDKKNWDVKIISGDQDLLQLVTDHVTVDLTRKGISEVNSYTPTTLLEEMELEPKQIIELKALMGDNS